MNFNEIENLIVYNDETFKKCIDLFTLTSSEDRDKYYEQLSFNNNTSKADIKNRLLQEMLSKFIKDRLKSSLNKVKIGATKEEILNEISFLNLLDPIFKEHDINNSESFISSIDSKISEMEVCLLKTKHILNEQEVVFFQEQLTKSIISKHSPVKTVDDYRKILLHHPMLKCLNSHKNSKSLIDNIENGIIEIGHYKNLIVSVLKSGLDLTRESHQRFLFFIINEDIKYNGLSNLINHPNYKPSEFKELLTKIIDGKNINSNEINSLAYDISQNHTKYIKYINGGLKELPSSVHSLVDSMFYSEFLNLYTHIHTAQDSGNNQNDQHSNASLVLSEHGFNTIGITITEKSIVDKVEFLTSYLNSYATNINLNKKEIAFMTALQIDAKEIDKIASYQIKNDPLVSKSLSNSIVLIEKNPYLELSIELARIRSEKTDINNIIEDKEFLFSIINKNMNLMQDIFSNTVSDNSKLFQHWAEPILTKIAAYLKFEKKFKVNLLNNDDINIIQNIIDIKSYNSTIISLKDTIMERIDSRKDYENTLSLDKNELIEWKNKDIVNTTNHLTAIKNVEEDVVGYFYNNPFNLNDYSKDDRNELLSALRNRLKIEWGEAYSCVDTQLEKTLNIFDDLVNGKTVTSSVGYHTHPDKNKHMLARLSKSSANDNRNNRVLNILAIAANITGARLYCYNADFKNKIRVKFT